MEQKTTKHDEGGAAMMIAVMFFVAASVLIVLGLTGPSAREFHTANEAFASHASYFLTESAAEDLYYRYKNALPSPSSTITIGSDTATATHSAFDSDNEDITAVGSVQNSQHTVDLHVGNGVADFNVHRWAQTE